MPSTRRFKIVSQRPTKRSRASTPKNVRFTMNVGRLWYTVSHAIATQRSTKQRRGTGQKRKCSSKSLAGTSARENVYCRRCATGRPLLSPFEKGSAQQAGYHRRGNVSSAKDVSGVTVKDCRGANKHTCKERTSSVNTSRFAPVALRQIRHSTAYSHRRSCSANKTMLCKRMSEERRRSPCQSIPSKRAR